MKFISSFLSFITFVFSFSSTTFAESAAKAKTNWNVGLSFSSAKKELMRGELDQAQVILENLSVHPGIENWLIYELASLEVERKQYQTALSLLKRIETSSAASVFAKILKTRIEIESSEDFEDSDLDRLKTEVKNSGITSLNPKLELLDALVLKRAGKTTDLLEKLQSIREKYAKTDVAYLAYRIQNTVIDKPTDTLPLLTALRISVPKYWAKELELLNKQGLSKEALALLDTLSKSGQYFVDIQDKDIDFIKAKVKTLSKNWQVEKLNQELNLLKKSENVEIKQFAWQEIARRAWNKNDYETAHAALSELPSDFPYRVFIEARIAEETGKLEQAKSLYSRVSSQDQYKINFDSKLRLAWLHINNESWDPAAAVLKKAKEIDRNKNQLDSEAINYWFSLSKNLGQPVKLGTPYQYRSFYYWLREGRKLVKKPDTKLVLGDKRILSKSCPWENYTLPQELQSKLEQLKSYGLFDLIRHEVLYYFSNSRDEKTVVKKLKALNKLGAVQSSFRHTFSTEIVHGSYSRRCPENITELLYPTPYFEEFAQAALRYEIDLALLLAIARTESAFHPLAISSRGARGLMQLMPYAAELEGLKLDDKDLDKLFNPSTNIDLGAKHLRRHLNSFNNQWHLAIAAYNGGPSAVERWLKRFPKSKPEVWLELLTYPETRNYVKKVMAAYWIYDELVL